MKRIMAMAALATAAAVVLTSCAQPTTNTTPSPEGATTAGGQNITLWLAGGDTPTALRDYLKTTYTAKTGGTLTIEEQAWPDLVAKLTTALPDENNTPDVVEVGNTQSPTFTNIGAFSDVSDLYAELGGDKLLQSFVTVGEVDSKKYTLPYYFGSRYMFYRKDLYQAAGIEVPTTLDEFNANVAKLAEKNPNKIKDFSGFFIGGQDWRNGISWIFANGGDLAKKEGDQWVSTLSDPNTVKGLQQLQEIHKVASNAPATAKDESPWLYINNEDQATEEDKSITETKLAAATIMAPGWAHWSIGDPVKNDKGETVREWNDKVFGVFALPGNDGKPAPVFAGGSNIGISAKSKNQEGSRELLKIIFSADYQKLLGENGLGPANSDYVDSLGTDEFAKALVESASNSKLTPAAPGWATVESSMKLEEFFSKVADGGDIAALATEYDAIITPMLNG
ncbi:MAG: extracellular solute-binding protein [Propionibacteriaceae bacterium]|jgi:N,N'-diacetylchitobiose transport system substrate-binding protein|nr:extracellular solute-binding protein [Propionibacteriaceae bacterium]